MCVGDWYRRGDEVTYDEDAYREMLSDYRAERHPEHEGDDVAHLFCSMCLQDHETFMLDRKERS